MDNDFELDRIADESEHEPRIGSFEGFTIEHNRNKWQVTGILGFFGWTQPTTFLVTNITPIHIEDEEDHESFEIALDYWMDEQGMDTDRITVRIGEWIQK